MFNRLLGAITLSCLSLFAQAETPAEIRLKFAEGVSRRYKTTGADKEFGYCVVAGPENKTLVHIIEGIKIDKAMILLAGKRTHDYLVNKGFTKIEFKSDSTTIILGATITSTGFILYNSAKEIPFLE